jgi:hypothetical protein
MSRYWTDGWEMIGERLRIDVTANIQSFCFQWLWIFAKTVIENAPKSSLVAPVAPKIILGGSWLLQKKAETQLKQTRARKNRWD